MSETKRSVGRSGVMRALVVAGLVWGVGGAGGGLARGTPIATELVGVELMVRGPGGDGRIEAGKPVTVLVRLKIEPGWHVYWLNPGDSGMATGVKLTLPAGWGQRGEWEYPLPTNLPESVVTYGYENEVVLRTTVIPPATPPASPPASPAAAAGGPVELKADVVYLVCKDVCLPGRLSAVTKLESAGTAGQAAAQLEERWKEKFPKAEEVEATFSSAIKGDKQWTDLSAEVPLPGEKGIKSAELFMLGSDEVELRETSATVKGMVVIIKSQAKLYTGTSVSPGTMRGLLVVTDDTAARRGYWVNFAVPPANAAVPRTKPAQGNK